MPIPRAAAIFLLCVLSTVCAGGYYNIRTTQALHEVLTLDRQVLEENAKLRRANAELADANGRLIGANDQLVQANGHLVDANHELQVQTSLVIQAKQHATMVQLLTLRAAQEGKQ